MELNEDWEVLADLPNVRFSEQLDSIDHSPFTPPYFIADEMDDEVFVWWDENM